MVFAATPIRFVFVLPLAQKSAEALWYVRIPGRNHERNKKRIPLLSNLPSIAMKMEKNASKRKKILTKD